MCARVCACVRVDAWMLERKRILFVGYSATGLASPRLATVSGALVERTVAFRRRFEHFLQTAREQNISESTKRIIRRRDVYTRDVISDGTPETLIACLLEASLVTRDSSANPCNAHPLERIPKNRENFRKYFRFAV